MPEKIEDTKVEDKEKIQQYEEMQQAAIITLKSILRKGTCPFVSLSPMCMGDKCNMWINQGDMSQCILVVAAYMAIGMNTTLVQLTRMLEGLPAVFGDVLLAAFAEMPVQPDDSETDDSENKSDEEKE